MADRPLDLVIRNARVATAADTFQADIGVRDGRIALLGDRLPAGREEIDAAGRVVTPGGVDAHCHLDQPMEGPARMADDFMSGTRDLKKCVWGKGTARKEKWTPQKNWWYFRKPVRSNAQLEDELATVR